MTQVYFASGGGRIKIGISKNVPQRLRGLQEKLPYPLELIGAIRGNGEVERAIFRKLAPFRIEGEWFRDCAETRAAITNCFNNFPPADVGCATPYAKFAAVARVVWPKKTAAHIAAVAGVTERNAERWLSGQFEPSSRTIAAIVVEITKPDHG